MKDFLYRAYMSVISEDSATADPVSKLEFALLTISYEEAGELALWLTMNAGMLDEDILKLASIIKQSNMFGRKAEHCVTVEDVKSTCKAWKEKWLDVYGENNPIGIDDFNTFDKMQWIVDREHFYDRDPQLCSDLELHMKYSYAISDTSNIKLFKVLLANIAYSLDDLEMTFYKICRKQAV
jgi:hypothetical protein